MIHFSHTDLDTLLSVGCHTDKECEYTHPESIYHCIVFDKILKLPGFCSPSTKRSKRTFIFMSRHQLPPKSSSQQILPMKDKEKPQLGVSRMVSACKGNENIEKLYCFRLLFYHNRKTFYLWRGTKHKKVLDTSRAKDFELYLFMKTQPSAKRQLPVNLLYFVPKRKSKRLIIMMPSSL